MDRSRAFACSRTMWSRASGSSVGIRTRSFEERFSVTTITVGSRVPTNGGRGNTHTIGQYIPPMWRVHLADTHSAQPPFPTDELASPAFRRLAARFSSFKLDPRKLCVSEQNFGEAR